MFERYSPPALRAVYLARYEAAQFGSSQIEPGHLLLGILRESGELIRRLVADDQRISELKASVENRQPRKRGSMMSVDLPLSQECKEVLATAAEEATRADLSYIGVENLLIGLMSLQSYETTDLVAAGITIEGLRSMSPVKPPSGTPNS